MPKTIIAVLVGSMFFAFGSSVGADELRKTVSLNTGTPDVKTLERALFPEEIVQKQKECEELEKKGFACQSVIPKASVETTQVTFARGSANLTESSKEFLRRIGQALKNKQGAYQTVVVEGHTDATGTQDINRNLSKKRADSVRAFLLAEYGIGNVETVGRASDMLKDKSNPGAAANRRIEFVIAK